MKKLYCKHCGLELERGKCICDASKNEKQATGSMKCTSCGKEIDSDSKYCPYCGIPTYGDKKDENLQKKLLGEYDEDVIVHYGIKKEKDIKRRGVIGDILSKISLVLIVALLTLFIAFFAVPVVKNFVNSHSISKIFDKEGEYTEGIEPTAEAKKEVRKNEWIEKDGYKYYLNEEGKPIIDDWQVIADADGVEKYYYFDENGRLVTDSWINEEYYVGEDGAMLKDTTTPDGKEVDKEGKIVVKETETVKKSEKKNVELDNGGYIKGQDATKSIYISELIKVEETVQNSAGEIPVTYYYPVLSGTDSDRVQLLNEQIKNICNEEFKNLISKNANSYTAEIKSIVIDEAKMSTPTSSKVQITLNGKINFKDMLSNKCSFRIVCKKGQVSLNDTTEKSN